MSAKLKKIRDEEESSCAGSGKAPFQESPHIVLDAVSSNYEWLGLTGPIQD